MRLADGPVSLSFALPYVETALSRSDGSLTVRMTDTVLIWSREDRSLEIKAMEARVFGSDGRLVAAVPEMSLTVSAVALFEGRVQPRLIRILHPGIRLVRDIDGQLRFGLPSTTETVATADDVGLVAAADTLTKFLGGEGTNALKRVDIVGGVLSVDDRVLGETWRLPTINLQLRRTAAGIEAHGHVETALDDKTATIETAATYNPEDHALDAAITAAGLVPAAIAKFSPALTSLESLKFTVGGTVVTHLHLGQGLDSVHFDLTGGAGTIDTSATLGIKTPVQSLTLRGGFDVAGGRLDLELLKIDRGEGVLTAHGTVNGIGGELQIDLDGQLQKLPLPSLASLWPKDAAPNPRAWVVSNMPKGVIQSGDVHVTAHLPAGQGAGELVVDGMTGHLNGEDVTVVYRAPMPPVVGTAFTSTFDLDEFRFVTRGGHVDGIAVPEGKITLSGLSKPDQFAAIDIRIAGPFGEAMRIFDGEPLNWGRKLGIAPASAAGDITADVHFRFPLISELASKDIGVHAEVQGTHIGGILNALPDHAFSAGELTVTVDKVADAADEKSGFDLVGKARIGDIPTDLKIRDNFSAKAPFDARIEATAVFSDDARRAYGLSDIPFQAPYLSGDLPAVVTVTIFDGGRTEIGVDADLTGAQLRLPSLNMNKTPGVAGNVQATIVLANQKIDAVPKFAVIAANGIDLAGDVQFDDGRPRRVAFRHAKWAKTDLSAIVDILPGDQGLSIEAAGASFDAREMLNGGPSDPEHKDTTPLKVRARVVQAWMSDDGVVSDVSATMEHDRQFWRTIRVDAKVGNDKPVVVDVHPDGADKTALKLTSGDAGAVLHDLGFYDDMVGGTLTIDGSWADTQPHRPLKGVAKVADFHVVHAPGLLRLLTLIGPALNAIADELNGAGISFTTLEAPFTKTDDGVLDLTDAGAYGAALGLTVHGQFDLDNKRVALEGSVVPMYVLNSAFDNLPLLGGLFTSEKGGGILAINYSVKGPTDDPDINANPLSAFAPGFLRGFFNLFGSGTVVRPKQPPDPPPKP